MLYWGYLVPATVLVVNFWAFWRFAVPKRLSIAARRRWFIGLGTLLFTPMIVWEDPGHLEFLALTVLPNPFYFAETLARNGINEVVFRYVMSSPIILITACITALPFALIAYVFVGRSTIEEHRRWLDAACLAVVVAGTLLLVKATVPAYGMSPDITGSVVESMYGPSLDALDALADISDTEAQKAEARRLKAQFRKDPTIIELYSVLRGEPDTNKVFSYKIENDLDANFCARGNPTAQRDLVLCVFSFARFNRRLKTEYERDESERSRVRVGIGLDYDSLLRRL